MLSLNRNNSNTMLKVIFSFILFLLSFFAMAQKNYLQNPLDKKLINEFYNYNEDDIIIKDGNFDEISGLLLNGIIEGYSSKYGAIVKLESNNRGRLNLISLSYSVNKLSTYNILIEQYMKRNLGKASFIPSENIFEEFTIVNSQYRNDSFTISANIEGSMNSFKVLVRPAVLYFLFVSIAI